MKTERFLTYYQSTPHFRIENPNPRWAEKKGMVWDTPDCCIRALSNAIDCSWLEAYDFLSSKARAEYTVPNDGVRFRKWLIENGAIWTAYKAVKGKKRMTVLDFAKSHPKGRFIITIAKHETACVDGVILDAWNCGGKCVVGYLDMNEFKLNVPPIYDNCRLGL